MSLYEKKYEYQEIRVNTLEDINEIIADYNSFYNLPRPEISAMDDPSVYLQTFFEDKAMHRGKSVPVWKVQKSRNIKF